MLVESWLSRAATSRPQAIAVEDGERALSYAELHATALAGAAELGARGVRAGESVAIALPPGLPFAVALHSCWLAGAAAAPVDTRLVAAERDQVAAGAALLLEEPLPVDRSATVEGAQPPPQTHDLDATAVVIHTSGTTSQPKHVELTFGNLLWSALGSGVALGIHTEERWLCTLPLCHVGGLSILVRSAIQATTAVLHERFETQRALHALTYEGITLISVVATTLTRLLDAGLQDPPGLRCALAGGGPVPAALLERAAAAGVAVCQTYGLTEACSQASTVPLAAVEAAGAGAAGLGAGRPLFCTRVMIAADGEILVAGPTVAPRALAQDGWLHTGDLGKLDERGDLHVSGRKSDTIVSGGENVAPAEVEAALEAHHEVAEAAVVGRSDPRWGEAVTAIVVPAHGAHPAEAELREHCAKLLAPYKVPKKIVLVTGPLPRTPSGKLLRRALSEG
jgi:o-succinylbenzoate---CoA ligase